MFCTGFLAGAVFSLRFSTHLGVFPSPFLPPCLSLSTRRASGWCCRTPRGGAGGGGVKIKRRVPPSDVEAGEGCLDVAGTGGCASSVYSFGVQLLLHFPYMASPNHDIQHSLSSSGASMAPGCNRHANLLCHSKLTLCHALYPPIKACYYLSTPIDHIFKYVACRPEKIRRM